MPFSQLFRAGMFAALIVAMPAAAQEEIPVDLELVLAVDVSGSIDEEEARLQRRGYVSALAHPQVIEAIESGPVGQIAIAYFEWANFQFQRMVVDWTLVSDKASADALAGAVAEAPIISASWTSLSGAIDYGAALFDGNGYEGLRRVIDVSGDGYNNSGRPVEIARDAAVAAGITINGLPIINQRPNPWGSPPAADLDLYFQERVIGGPGAFIIVAHDFTDFARAVLAKLILEIAGGEDPEPARRLAFGQN